jgi:CubicO group peptidase (beta-lactamase class C family)
MTKKKGKSKILIFLLFLVIFAAAIGGTIYYFKFIAHKDPEPEPTPTAEPEPEPEPEPDPTPTEINLQSVVDSWTKAHPKTGVYIYDLDNEAPVAEYKKDTKYRIESIYKLFVAYEGYKQITAGKMKADEKVAIANDFKGNKYTISLCLDHMIRYSYSPCGEYVWSKIGHNNLQKTYENLGFKNTSIGNLMASASDLVKLLELIHTDDTIDEKLRAQLFDSMLNQKANTKDTRYNSDWRKGLPSGFSTTKVYNKVGWLGDGNGHWIYFDDVALLYFPETTDKEGNKVPERHLAIAVLTTSNTTPKQIGELGKNIENAVKKHDNY